MPDTTAGESWTTSEERMKELIAQAWDVVKRLTLQVPVLLYNEQHKRASLAFRYLSHIYFLSSSTKERAK